MHTTVIIPPTHSKRRIGVWNVFERFQLEFTEQVPFYKKYWYKQMLAALNTRLYSEEVTQEHLVALLALQDEMNLPGIMPFKITQGTKPLITMNSSYFILLFSFYFEKHPLLPFKVDDWSFYHERFKMLLSHQSKTKDFSDTFNKIIILLKSSRTRNEFIEKQTELFFSDSAEKIEFISKTHPKTLEIFKSIYKNNNDESRELISALDSIIRSKLNNGSSLEAEEMIAMVQAFKPYGELNSYPSAKRPLQPLSKQDCVNEFLYFKQNVERAHENKIKCVAMFGDDAYPIVFDSRYSIEDLIFLRQFDFHNLAVSVVNSLQNSGLNTDKNRQVFCYFICNQMINEHQIDLVAKTENESIKENLFSLFIIIKNDKNNDLLTLNRYLSSLKEGSERWQAALVKIAEVLCRIKDYRGKVIGSIILGPENPQGYSNWLQIHHDSYHEKYVYDFNHILNFLDFEFILSLHDEHFDFLAQGIYLYKDSELEKLAIKLFTSLIDKKYDPGTYNMMNHWVTSVIHHYPREKVKRTYPRKLNFILEIYFNFLKNHLDNDQGVYNVRAIQIQILIFSLISPEAFDSDTPIAEQGLVVREDIISFTTHFNLIIHGFNQLVQILNSIPKLNMGLGPFIFPYPLAMFGRGTLFWTHPRSFTRYFRSILSQKNIRNPLRELRLDLSEYIDEINDERIRIFFRLQMTYPNFKSTEIENKLEEKLLTLRHFYIETLIPLIEHLFNIRSPLIIKACSQHVSIQDFMIAVAQNNPNLGAWFIRTAHTIMANSNNDETFTKWFNHILTNNTLVDENSLPALIRNWNNQPLNDLDAVGPINEQLQPPLNYSWDDVFSTASGFILLDTLKFTAKDNRSDNDFWEYPVMKYQGLSIRDAIHLVYCISEDNSKNQSVDLMKMLLIRLGNVCNDFVSLKNSVEPETDIILIAEQSLENILANLDNLIDNQPNITNSYLKSLI